MPILVIEPHCYPDHLWDGDGPQLTEGRSWWCLHTKPRQEKATARHLHAFKLTYYLPLIAREDRTPAGRKYQTTRPLFPGYVFFHGDDQERMLALKGNRLAGMIEVTDQVRLIEDLRRIRRLLSQQSIVFPIQNMPGGCKARIVEGPLEGFDGILAGGDAADLFIVILPSIGQGLLISTGPLKLSISP